MTDVRMHHATSADGTPIAFRTEGDGRPVVIIGGAFSTAEAGAPLAAALAGAGYRGVMVDRRGRGSSGDTAPYLPEREAEDVAAVIDALGGDAIVFGHSSGGVLALLSASMGVPMTHLFLSEPPFRFGEDEPPEDLPERLQALVDDGRPEEAVTVFQREAVGIGEELIAQVRESPLFDQLVPLAQSTVYDAVLTRAVSMPTAAMLTTDVPVTLLRGEQTFPFLAAATDRLAGLMPQAELVVVPESRDHSIDPPATVRVISARIRR